MALPCAEVDQHPNGDHPVVLVVRFLQARDVAHGKLDRPQGAQAVKPRLRLVDHVRDIVEAPDLNPSLLGEGDRRIAIGATDV